MGGPVAEEVRMSVENVSTVQAIYAAFGAGDVAGVLAHVQRDTQWDFAGARPEVPWHRPVDGADAVPAFFGTLAEAVDFQRFEPRVFVHAGPHVMVEVRMAYVVRATGRAVEMDQIHWWTLRDGKVARLRHFEDTAQVAAAVA